MTIKVKKDTLKGGCRSCGKVSKLDSTHNIAKHILKNPPVDQSEFDKKTKKEPKKGGKKEDKKGKANEGKKGEGELIKPVEDASLATAELGEAITRIKDYKNLQKRTSQELLEEITNITATQGYKTDLKYYVALHGLFDEKFLYQWVGEQNLKDAIKTLVKKDNVKGQCWLLLALQQFTLKTYPTALAQQINTIMNYLYEENVLDEQILIKIYSDSVQGEEQKEKEIIMKGKTYNNELDEQFKKVIEPFITWLKYILFK
jgi:hypothetical protein